MTVSELRSQLDAMEQNWSEQDRQVLGEFGDQLICVEAIGSDGRYAGIGLAGPAYFDACFGIMLMRNERRRR